ncbi:MAG: DUF362 domain-containing protein [candidate division WOR-3 bacterium]
MVSSKNQKTSRVAEAVSVYFLPVSKIDSASIKKVPIVDQFLRSFPANSKIGIKVHFGEQGNRNYLRPEYVKMIVDLVKGYQLQPFLIETSTLYRGARQNRKSHIALAREHGFGPELIGAPILILDGERGEGFAEVKINLPYVKVAKVAKDLNQFDGLINLAHFKGHFVVGFGGVIKNIAMGLAAKGGKLAMHSQTKPSVKKEKCQKCETCLTVCPVNAIVISTDGAKINKHCIGCASCVEICPENAIKINWNETSPATQKKMAEYAWAILKNRKCLHFNYALKITPNCDCMNIAEMPIMPDIGLFISLDPVANDRAVFNLTKEKINELYPQLDPTILLDYAEEIGLGKNKYSLITI